MLYKVDEILKCEHGEVILRYKATREKFLCINLWELSSSTQSFLWTYVSDVIKQFDFVTFAVTVGQMPLIRVFKLPNVRKQKIKTKKTVQGW